MLEATVERCDGALEIVVGETRIELGHATVAAYPAVASYSGHPIVLGIRPESLEDAALVTDGARQRLPGRTELREAPGSDVLVHFSIAARQAVTDDVRELVEDVGDDRRLERLVSGVESRATLVGRFSPHTRTREGDTIEVALDERSLHFFDPRTGLAICNTEREQ